MFGDCGQTKKLNCSNLFKRIVLCLRRTIDEVSQSSNAHPSKESTTSILTCVRLLTRVMPFMLEDFHDEFVRALFWRQGGYLPPVQQEFRQQIDAEIKEVVSNGRHSSSGNVHSTDGSASSHVDKQFEYITIGLELLASLQHLLFLKGFACPASTEVIDKEEALPRHKLDSRFTWKGGIGTSADLPTSHTSQMLKNRLEVLRCILICLSGSLYQTIDEYQHVAPVWLRVFTRGEFPYTANVFSSLMSFIFSHNPTGYGVPYGRVFSSGADESQLVQMSLELLAVLFDFNPSLFYSSYQSPQPTSTSNLSMPSSGSADYRNEGSSDNAAAAQHMRLEGGGASSSSSSSAPPRNVYRSMLSSIKKESEIDFIFDGFVRLLETVPQAKNTYLPRSQRSITYSQELLLVFWHLMTMNSHFLRRVSSQLSSNRLLTPILYLLLDASHARVQHESSSSDEKTVESGPSRVGVLHMCSFLLLVMSSERDFAVRLNQPVTERFPLDIPVFEGSHADLLVLVIHRVVTDSTASSSNDSLIDMLLTVMCNISAYIKTFCLESCVKLISLLQRFSRPSWLFSAPYHYHDIFFLLDMFNNLIQYQYEGNQRLVYSILRQKDFFNNLENMQFPAKYNNQSDDTTSDKQEQSVDNRNKATDGDHVDATNSVEIKNQPPPREGKHEMLHKDEENSNREVVWTPTEEWFTDWKAKLPLQTVSRLIQCLLPMVETECQEKGLIDQNEVLEYLHKTTLVGLLPVPHPIIIRNYQPNAYTSLWFTSYMWGLLFSQSQSLLLYDWRKIRLIVINNRTSTNTTKLSHSSSEDVDQVPSANTTTTTAVVVEKVATGVA